MNALRVFVASFAGALNLDPVRLGAATAAFVHSVWVTFIAFALGQCIGAAAAGATSFGAILAFAKANWVAWTVTNIAAPLLRGAQAAIKPPATS